MGVHLLASGASFPGDLYLQLVALFQERNSDTIGSFMYNVSSSNNGQADQYYSRTHWGSSDIAINKTSYPGPPELIALPSVGAAIIVAVNIPNLHTVTPLKLSRNVLPLIFSGNLTSWNDPRLLRDQDDSRLVSLLTSMPGSPRIQLIVRSPGSGTSANFVKVLRRMEPAFPPMSDWSTVLPDAFVANSNPAVGNILSSVPYTMTYMDAHELIGLLSALSPPNTPPVASYIQNAIGEFVLPTADSVANAFASVNASELASLDLHTAAASVLDPPGVAGVYPMAVITNVVIRTNAIADDVDIARAVLQFIWWMLTDVTLPDLLLSMNFTTIRSTPLSNLTLSYLQSYTHSTDPVPLYGQSICDIPGACQHGSCPSTLPFQPATATCQCDRGWTNLEASDCSERIPVFDWSDTTVPAQLGMGVFGVLVVGTVWALMLVTRGHPRMRTISPLCCQFVLAGCAVGELAVIMYAVTPTDWVCNVRIFLPAIAFGLVFGMIMLKTYRIYAILGYSKASKSRAISDLTLIAVTMGLTVIEVLLCLIDVLVSKPRGVLVQLPVITVQAGGGAGVVYAATATPKTYVACQASDGRGEIGMAIEIIIYLYNALVLVGALSLAFMTRRAYTKYSESKAIGYVTYSVTVALVLALNHK
ncbi:hypothetical protein HK101_010050 [Irineochytrium annulatum]|nr:hypothetical protein HK101_010050 [Irineochytrium annulatum]